MYWGVFNTCLSTDPQKGYIYFLDLDTFFCSNYACKSTMN